jgi:hypothetical protein
VGAGLFRVSRGDYDRSGYARVRRPKARSIHVDRLHCGPCTLPNILHVPVVILTNIELNSATEDEDRHTEKRREISWANLAAGAEPGQLFCFVQQ